METGIECPNFYNDLNQWEGIVSGNQIQDAIVMKKSISKPNYHISFFSVLLVLLYLSTVPANAEVISPSQYFGFQPGSDRMLLDYEELIEYLTKLATESPRLDLREIGESPQGRKMYCAFFSTAENINNLENLRDINRQLALDPEIPNNQREVLLKNGKVFFMAALSMHSGEVGPSQSAPIIAYDLVTTADPQVLDWLDKVVYMMVPCHNPDGMDMVVNHYKKYKGTKYEGSSMPGIYHKYVGHDNNRDFVTLSQSDTKAIARLYNTEWYPQIMVEKHQMGSRGPRYFVPPMHDPIAENVNESLWNWTWVLGSNLITDMTEAGLAGISQHYLFDDYWPGSTETCNWKGVIGLLTEAASVKYATPIFIEPTELTAYGKGLSEYKKSINMPLPWPGGWWKLSDIVEYEIVSIMSLLKTSALHRREILAFRNTHCRQEVDRGKSQPPYYYILPQEQHDASEFVNLVNLLIEHGISVFELTHSFISANRVYQEGDLIIPLAQPYRPFIKEVMEAQVFPVRHYTPGGKIIRPYDITSWSLPLHKGVTAIEINDLPDQQPEMRIIAAPFNLKSDDPGEFWAALLTANYNESYLAAFKAKKAGLKVDRLLESISFDDLTVPKGSFLIYWDRKKKTKLAELIDGLEVAPVFIEKSKNVKTTILEIPRIALVESYFHDMDAGWTRYVFDTYGLPYQVVRPGDFEKTDFAKKYDVVVFPNENKSVLEKGKYKSDDEYFISAYPPEFTKGIGDEGQVKLMTFLDGGGIIIAWGRSTKLFTGQLEIKRGKDEVEEFQLPFKDISEKVRKAGLYCPGSLIKILLLEDHPITLGMEPEIGVFSRGNPVFSTSFPNFDMDRRVIGKFPETDILLSGYCENEEKMGNKAGIVWLKKGQGQLVLFAFNPQFRASTSVSYKLMFNSILLSETE